MGGGHTAIFQGWEDDEKLRLRRGFFEREGKEKEMAFRIFRISWSQDIKRGEKGSFQKPKKSPPGQGCLIWTEPGHRDNYQSVLHPFWEIVEIFGRTQIFGGQLEVRSLCSEKNGHFAAPVLRN